MKGGGFLANEMQNTHREKIIRAFPFLDLLSLQDKDLFIDNTIISKYEENATLFSSESCKGILLVLSGSVRVYILSDEGREITLYRLHDGDICVLSFSCVLGTMPMQAIVEAQVQSTIAVQNQEIFTQLHAKYPVIQKFVLESMTGRMADVMWILDQVAFRSMDVRVGRYILSKNSRIIYATHDEIAREIGSAREVVSRMLKYFEKNGLIKSQRGKFEICDTEKLRKFIGI